MSPTAGGLDQAALEALYTRLEKPLYNVVYRWLWNAQDAGDVVQEAFVRLWRMRDRVDPSTVEPLVYRIAVNLASNRRRATRRWRWLPLTDRSTPRTATDPSDDLLAGERHDRLRKAVDDLPDKQRAVVMLCEFSELTYDQVAQALDIPAGTVASRRHQAVARLRKALVREDS